MKKGYLWAFSIITVGNLFLVMHIEPSGNLRDSIEQNYIRGFHWWEFILVVAFCCGLYAVAGWFIGKVIPSVQSSFTRCCIEEKRWQDGKVFRFVFLFIFAVWLFFFLVLYPGTAMNDTIFILGAPEKHCYQHPVLYILYTCFFYKIGVALGNPNIGLALLSMLQMVFMDYVITHAIVYFYKRRLAGKVCCILAGYFAFAPLFSTYAVSAIKDTPFSIALFYLIILLLELADSKGERIKDIGFCMRCMFAIFILVSFRSNGLLIGVGTFVILFIVYKAQRMTLLVSFFVPICISCLLSEFAMPIGVEKLFQEKIGIPLQQVSAVVASGGELSEAQREYLYELLPEEEWQNYAPSCADNIKWNSAFDRDYLNETKEEFMKLWLELLPENIPIYIEAYVMNTYGVWGIETRNSEQYYVKDIYPNELGLYQDSPLPEGIRELIYRFYCNRFTYRYLSEGTAFWILFLVTLGFLGKKKYGKAAAFCPGWLCFMSLLLATPIAFAFRYVFFLALLFPFLLFIPFMPEETE